MSDQKNYGFSGNPAAYTKPDVVAIDFDRLRVGVAQPFVMVPSGLSREELRALILSHAK